MNLDIKLTNYSLTILNLLNRDRNHSYFGVTGVSCNFFFKLLMAQHYISSINASFRLHDMYMILKTIKSFASDIK